MACSSDNGDSTSHDCKRFRLRLPCQRKFGMRRGCMVRCSHPICRILTVPEGSGGKPAPVQPDRYTAGIYKTRVSLLIWIHSGVRYPFLYQLCCFSETSVSCCCCVPGTTWHPDRSILWRYSLLLELHRIRQRLASVCLGML